MVRAAESTYDRVRLLVGGGEDPALAAPNDERLHGGRLRQELRRRRVERVRNIPEGADARIRKAVLDLAQERVGQPRRGAELCQLEAALKPKRVEPSPEHVPPGKVVPHPLVTTHLADLQCTSPTMARTSTNVFGRQPILVSPIFRCQTFISFGQTHVIPGPSRRPRRRVQRHAGCPARSPRSCRARDAPSPRPARRGRRR